MGPTSRSFVSAVRSSAKPAAGRSGFGTSKASSASVPMPPARASAASSSCALPLAFASNGSNKLDE